MVVCEALMCDENAGIMKFCGMTERKGSMLTKRRFTFLHCLLFLLVFILAGGCAGGGGGNSFSSASEGYSDIVINFNKVLNVNARAVTDEITHISCYCCDENGTVVYGPYKKEKADKVVLPNVPLIATSIGIDYLDGNGRNIGFYSQPIALNQKNTAYEIDNPDWEDIDSVPNIISDFKIEAEDSVQLGQTITCSVIAEITKDDQSYFQDVSLLCNWKSADSSIAVAQSSSKPNVFKGNAIGETEIVASLGKLSDSKTLVVTPVYWGSHSTPSAPPTRWDPVPDPTTGDPDPPDPVPTTQDPVPPPDPVPTTQDPPVPVDPTDDPSKGGKDKAKDTDKTGDKGETGKDSADKDQGANDTSDKGQTGKDGKDKDKNGGTNGTNGNAQQNVEPEELEEHYYTKASFYGDFSSIISLDDGGDHLGVLKEITDLKFVSKLPAITCNATFYGLGAENWLYGKRDIFFSLKTGGIQEKFKCLASYKVIDGYKTSGIENRCFQYYSLKCKELANYVKYQVAMTEIAPAEDELLTLPDCSFAMKRKELKKTYGIDPDSIARVLKVKEYRLLFAMVEGHTNFELVEITWEELRRKYTEKCRLEYEAARDESNAFYQRYKNSIDLLRRFEENFKGEDYYGVPSWWLDWRSFCEHYGLGDEVEINLGDGGKTLFIPMSQVQVKDGIAFNRKNTSAEKFTGKVMRAFAGEEIDDKFIKGLVKYGFLEPRYTTINLEVVDDRLKIRGDKDPYIKDVFYVISTSASGELKEKELYKFSDLEEYINTSPKYKYASEFVNDPANYWKNYEFTLRAYSVSDPTVKTNTPIKLQLEVHLTNEEYESLIDDHEWLNDWEAKKIKKIVYLKKTRDNYSGYL